MKNVLFSLLFSRLTNKFLLLLFSSVICTFNNSKTAIASNPRSITGERWLTHVEEDLNPFFEIEDAWGDEIGNFPTRRTNTGLFNPNKNPLNHFVAQSRQTFAYGVAYHLTGESKFLTLAKAGVDWIGENGIDQTLGGTYKYLSQPSNTPDNNFNSRTSQEQAYALQGMAFYYYLTRDEDVLNNIVSLKNDLFDTYYDDSRNVMNFLPTDTVDSQLRLTATLDQLNTYLLLLTPIVPDDYKQSFETDLQNLSQSLLDNFYSSEYNVFWLREGNNQLLERQTDYGHSIKSLWMLQQAGEVLNDNKLINFAEKNATELLAEAFHEPSGSWANDPYFDENGNFTQDLNKDWWIYQELDQMAGTMCLQETSFCDDYLENTVNWYFDNMVDKTYGGVYQRVSADGLTARGKKQWKWKSGFHSYEHALVGYITSQFAVDEEIQVHYAHTDDICSPTGGLIFGSINPYYYEGDITQCQTNSILSTGNEELDLILGESNYQQTSITFSFNNTESVPEPLTIIGTIVAGIIGTIIKKKIPYDRS